MPKKPFNPAQVPTAIALESVSVATPCHADWNAMHGDDRSRFCPSCAKNVYNLSAMTKNEAEGLLQEKEGRLCVRFFLREDGTMLTQDCPVGVAALKERSPSFALWAGVASLVLLVGALVSPSFLSTAQAQPEPKGSEVPAQTATPEPEKPCYPARMGDIAAPVNPTVAPTPEAAPTVAPTAAHALAPTMGKPMMPRATPKPVREIRGEVSVVPTPKTEPLVETLGEAAVAPTPKPTPRPHTMVLGRMAVRPKAQPTPKPAAQEAPAPLMGMVAMPPRPAQPKPSPKTKTPKKKSPSAKHS